MGIGVIVLGLASNGLAMAKKPETQIKDIELESIAKEYKDVKEIPKIVEYNKKNPTVKYFSYTDNKKSSVKLATNQCMYQGMIIEGPEYFRNRTIKSLNMLRDKYREGYLIVLYNTRKIEWQDHANGRSYQDSWLKLLNMNGLVYQGDSYDKQYAAALIHEATHIEQDILDLNEEEKIAYKRTIKALKALGESKRVIKYYQDYLDNESWKYYPDGTIRSKYNTERKNKK